MKTRTIPAGEFKAKCLALMDEIAASGDEIVVTKRGKPVVRVKPERPLGRNEPDLRGTLLWEAEDAWEPLGVEWSRPGKFDDISE